jgi:hypothetical protein
VLSSHALLSSEVGSCEVPIGLALLSDFATCDLLKHCNKYDTFDVDHGRRRHISCLPVPIPVFEVIG